MLNSNQNHSVSDGAEVYVAENVSVLNFKSDGYWVWVTYGSSALSISVHDANDMGKVFFRFDSEEQKWRIVNSNYIDEGEVMVIDFDGDGFPDMKVVPTEGGYSRIKLDVVEKESVFYPFDE